MENIIEDECEKITKDSNCFVKCNSMLTKIAICFT